LSNHKPYRRFQDYESLVRHLTLEDCHLKQFLPLLNLEPKSLEGLFDAAGQLRLKHQSQQNEKRSHGIDRPERPWAEKACSPITGTDTNDNDASQSCSNCGTNVHGRKVET